MSCSIKVYLIPLRQGLLLTLELDWQPAGPSDLLPGQCWVYKCLRIHSWLSVWVFLGI